MDILWNRPVQGSCPTKAAIIGLTKAMAIDHGHERVRVNCICPGYIDAELAEGYFQSQADPSTGKKGARQTTCTVADRKPEEVGNVAVSGKRRCFLRYRHGDGRGSRFWFRLPPNKNNKNKNENILPTAGLCIVLLVHTAHAQM